MRPAANPENPAGRTTYRQSMAGGMSGRRDDWIGRESLQRNAADDAPTPVKRCWVLEDGGRQPGLLLEWRRTAAGWQGRVVHPVRHSSGWVVVEDWLSAEVLEPD